MGCLNFDSEKKSKSLNIELFRDSFLDAVIDIVIAPLSFVLSKINRTTEMTFARNGGLNAEFGLICTRGEEKYLEVTPTRLYFFTGKFEDYVAVLSNTIWHAAN